MVKFPKIGEFITYDLTQESFLFHLKSYSSK